MQSSNWAPEHSQALREYLGQRMSYAAAADAINVRFGTAYTRNAAIGRGKRMGLADVEHAISLFKSAPRPSGPILKRIRKRRAAEPKPILALPEQAEPVKLRCVGVSPRLISLIELEAADCRYPYGGDKDGDPISFCGHRRLTGTSYCAAHFHLTRGARSVTIRLDGCTRIVRSMMRNIRVVARFRMIGSEPNAGHRRSIPVANMSMVHRCASRSLRASARPCYG